MGSSRGTVIEESSVEKSFAQRVSNPSHKFKDDV